MFIHDDLKDKKILLSEFEDIIHIKLNSSNPGIVLLTITLIYLSLFLFFSINSSFNVFKS